MGKSNNSTPAAEDKRNRLIILIVTLFLSVALILASILISVFSYNDNYYDNYNNSNNNHSVSGSLRTGNNSIYVGSSSDGVYYSFTPSNSGRYTFYSSTSSYGLDPAAVLYNSNWSQLDSDDDGAGNNRDFSLSYNLTSYETYYLKVTTHSGSGSITVTVNRAYSTSGSLHTGSNSIYVGSSSDGVYYSFTPSSSGQYTFYSSNSSSGLDPEAVLYDSNWSQLDSDDDGAGNNRDFSLSYNLTAGKTYYLKVAAHSGYGSTTVTVNRTYSTSGSLSVNSGTYVSVGSSSDGVYYSFTPSSSGQYTFYSSNSSSGFDPKAVLYDSNWSQLDSDDDGAGNRNFSLSYDLTAEETYYLKVAAHSGYGSTTVTVTRTYSISGSLHTGNNSIYVESSSDGVYYSFTPSNSGRYTFYSSHSSSSLDPKAVLYDSNWSQLDSDDDGADNNRDFSLSYDLTANETYYLKVTTLNGSGSITVTVNRAYSTNGSLSVNSGTSVSVGSSSDGVYYSFTPSSSGQYTFYSSNSSSGLDPEAVLYDSNWSQLDSDDDGAGNSRNFSLSYNLTAGKTYYLKVAAHSGYGSTTVYVQKN